jgi:hypothetical protein
MHLSNICKPRTYEHIQNSTLGIYVSSDDKGMLGKLKNTREMEGVLLTLG